MAAPYLVLTEDGGMEESSEISSIEYLPEDLRDKDFHQKATELIDLIVNKQSAEVSLIVVDDIIKKIITHYGDEEALGAYYNTFIRGILGTKTALEFLLDLLNLTPRGEWIEWFKAEWPTPPYKISLNFGDKYPVGSDPGNPFIDWDKLIDMFDLVKNERSKIFSIRMEECANNFTWDYSNWDADLWDDIEGQVYRGIHFCLYEKHSFWHDFTTFEFPVVEHMYTSRKSAFYDCRAISVYGFVTWGQLPRGYGAWGYMWTSESMTYVHMDMHSIHENFRMVWECQPTPGDYTKWGDSKILMADVRKADHRAVFGYQDWGAFGYRYELMNCEIGKTNYFFDDNWSSMYSSSYLSESPARVLNFPNVLKTIQSGYNTTYEHLMNMDSVFLKWVSSRHFNLQPFEDLFSISDMMLLKTASKYKELGVVLQELSNKKGRIRMGYLEPDFFIDSVKSTWSWELGSNGMSQSLFNNMIM